MIRQCIIFLCLLVCASTLAAETIYKSIDESGRVSYSTTPAPDSKESSKVELPPPPSDARIWAAQERHQQNLRSAEILDENRKRRNEIITEENRIKQQRQKQAQNNTQQQEKYDRPAYPYYLRRYPGTVVPPDRPIIDRPVFDRPVHLPAR